MIHRQIFAWRLDHVTRLPNANCSGDVKPLRLNSGRHGSLDHPKPAEGLTGIVMVFDKEEEFFGNGFQLRAELCVSELDEERIGQLSRAGQERASGCGP